MSLEKIIYEEIEVMKFITGDKWKQNTYLLSDHKCKLQLIIDPGYGCKTLISNQINIAYEIYVIATHAHHDHIAGVQELCDSLDTECYLDERDKRIYMHVSTYSVKFAGKYLKRPERICWLNDTTRQELMTKNIKIIQTSGHTKGSIAILYKKFIFTGDTLLKELIGRTDLPGSEKSELIESVNKLLQIDICDGVICPGHGEIWNLQKAKDWWVLNKSKAKELNSFI